MAKSDLPRALYLLDGMALAYRAYFALIRNPIRTSDGVNTSALFGFANVLEDIRKRRGASHLAVVWDTSAPTFRHERYPEYKAQRDAMPEDLREAIPHIKRWVEALDLPTLECDGWEADDVIATLAARAEQEGCEICWMVTADKDFGQLVTEHVHVLRPGRQGADEEEWTPEVVCERWDIQRVDQVIDMLGLMGDASDNIPGVPGVGEKTAAKFLKAYDTIEGVLRAAQAGKIKGKIGEKVAANADLARLSYELATIVPTAPVELNWQALEVGEPNREALAALCIEFELNTLGKKLLGDDFHAGRQGSTIIKAPDSPQASGPKPQADSGDLFSAHEIRFDPAAVDYAALSDPAEIASYLKELSHGKQFAFDTETDSLVARHARLLGVSFASKINCARFLILPAADGPQRDAVLHSLRQFFATYRGRLIAQNLKYDLTVLRAHDIDFPQAQPFDTLLAAGLLDITQRRGMDYLAESLLGYRPISYVELTGSSKKTEQKSLSELLETKADEVTNYACEDADITLQIAEVLRPRLEESEPLSRLLAEIEGPLTPVLVRMEEQGIRLDPEALEGVRAELGDKIEGIVAEIRAEAGEEINLNSPKQLGEFLFDKLKLSDKPKKTKTGQYVTNEQVLSQLAAQHEIAQRILDYREATKLKNTYVDPLPGHIDPSDGRIHTSYQQLAATTGRLASTDPNLQNIPVRSELGRTVRRAFVPRSADYTLLSCDYSQIELRIMAHLSGDAALKQAFEDQLDIHAATAARVFGLELSEVLPEMRRAAKMVNFGIIYGISAFGLSQRLGIPRREAAEIIEGYWKSYPGVREFMLQVVKDSKQRGYGQTILGRRCPMPDLANSNAVVRANAERFAINMPIQGSAADLIKKAMVDIDALLMEQDRKTKLLLQVHDELVFDLHRDEADALIPQLVEKMETAAKLDVPLVVDHGQGENWLEAH